MWPQFRLILICMMLCLLASCAAYRSQEHDYLTRFNPNRCETYDYNLYTSVPQLHQSGHLDSISLLLDYVIKECGMSPDLQRLKFLLAIEQDRFDDSLIDDATIGRLLSYRRSTEWGPFTYRLRFLYGESLQRKDQATEADSFMVRWSRRLSDSGGLEGEEVVLALFYSGRFDSAFALLQSPALVNTKLAYQYRQHIEAVRNEIPGRVNFSLGGGVWSPLGDNKVLGNKTELALNYGGEAKRWRFDLMVATRVGESKNPIVVTRNGVPELTTAFSSFALGGDLGYKFFRSGRFDTNLFGSIAWGYLLTIKLTDDKYRSHESWSASGGMRIRYFIEQRLGWYVGGWFRYNLVDYPNSGGTELGGNTMSVGLHVGISTHATLRAIFKSLNYRGPIMP